MINMLWSILLGVILLGILWYIYNQEENPLDRLPGPPRLPFIGSALFFIKLSPRDVFLKIREFIDKYGDRYVVRVLWRRILHVSNVNDMEVVLSHSKNIDKSLFYTFLKPWLGTGLLISTGSKWHSRRKILTPTFHFNILKDFLIIMDEKSQHLVNQLKKQKETEVNLLPTISDFTLNTICETAMGTQLDQNQSASIVEYKKAIEEIGSLLMNRIMKVYLHNDFIFNQLPAGKKFEKCLNTVKTFADSVIAERKKQRESNNGESGSQEDTVGGKKRLAMLDFLLEAESKGQIDVEGIKEEVNTFMFEGHDTTATALTFALMLIAEDDAVQSRIYEELQQVVGDSDHRLTMSELSDLKYLEAVIKETLRMYPSVPFISRTITEDFTLDDILVKKGTEVAVHIYDLHRREDLYPEPHVFRPERFLEGESRHPYAFIPFSAGPRNCIGQRFAMIEMKCVLSEICRNFTLTPKKKGFKPQLMTDMLLRPMEPIHVKFIRR